MFDPVLHFSGPLFVFPTLGARTSDCVQMVFFSIKVRAVFLVDNLCQSRWISPELCLQSQMTAAIWNGWNYFQAAPIFLLSDLINLRTFQGWFPFPTISLLRPTRSSTPGSISDLSLDPPLCSQSSPSPSLQDASVPTVEFLSISRALPSSSLSKTSE